MNLDKAFELLWQDYISLNPQTKKIYDAFVSKGETVINDHVAFRTFNGTYGIDHYAKTFTNLGYIEAGTYEFTEKKLFAKHFEHKNPDLPKVFISELKTADFSNFLQDVVRECERQISSKDAQAEDFFVKTRLWKADYKTYTELLKESEYAAWLYAFGFRANHFTVNVNRLNHFKTIPEVNTFIESLGFALNDSGGRVKGSPEELLEQSSTKATKTLVSFSDGSYEIPACYYEFALRYPMEDGKLYQGFVAKSANKIFESTNTY